ncbi:MAG: hypothetical protein ETSY1_15405, partial [Candidatus Entotheonella factor]
TFWTSVSEPKTQQSWAFQCDMTGAKNWAKNLAKKRRFWTAYPYPHSYLLCLMGYGETDMIHFYDEDGNFIPTVSMDDVRLGDQFCLVAKSLRLNHVIPFSSFHQYQRTDSIWANQYTTPLTHFSDGIHDDIEFVPPFVTIDCRSGEIELIDPEPYVTEIQPPEFYGDSWSEELSQGERDKIDAYFTRKDGVRQFLSFLNFRVGGKDHLISLDGTQDKGITFEVPRHSLMTAIDYEIFDDLLIGNFMKTTLHNLASLYEGDFNFYVTKYGDNGRAQSTAELERYFRAYRRRMGKAYLYELFTNGLETFGKKCLARTRGSAVYATAKKAYYTVVK